MSHVNWSLPAPGLTGPHSSLDGARCGASGLLPLPREGAKPERPLSARPTPSPG